MAVPSKELSSFACAGLNPARANIEQENDMIIFTRKKGESIVIGDDIEVVVTDIKGDKVYLGIKAPRTISVYRKETHEAIQREKAVKEQP